MLLLIRIELCIFSCLQRLVDLFSEYPSLLNVVGTRLFWFAWQAFHPETRVYAP